MHRPPSTWSMLRPEVRETRTTTPQPMTISTSSIGGRTVALCQKSFESRLSTDWSSSVW